MKQNVTLLGIRSTKFGDRFARCCEKSICEATLEAYADAAIEPEKIPAAYLDTYLPRPSGGEAATSLGAALGLHPSGTLPSFRPPIGAGSLRRMYECLKQFQGTGDKPRGHNSKVHLLHKGGGLGAVPRVVVLGN